MAPKIPATLVEALLQHASRGPDRGFRFIGADSQERFFTYAAMLEEARNRGSHLRARGLQVNDRVALVLGEGHEFVLSFLGAIYAGLIPVPIYPRASFKAIEAYQETVSHIIQSAGAKALITAQDMLPFLTTVAQNNATHDGLREVLTADTAFAGTAPHIDPVIAQGDDLCFLQFTSGSTARPKGVMVTHASLHANSSAFLGPEGLNRTDEDLGVSWLPLYHDMGLIGFILATILFELPVVVMPTASFARRPLLWLDVITRFRATITYAPNFAYQLLAKRVKDSDLAALNLSTLRVAGCGAEPIRAQTLRDFAQRLAPAGFRPDIFLPSYGMAEATLALTFHPLGQPIVTETIDTQALAEGRAVPAKADDPHALELVSCGVTFTDHQLKVVNAEGQTLKEREVGEVVVKGPSVTEGYFNNPTATQQAYRDGWLHTGDLGYISAGNLYICGRLKDLIIIRGANYYPQDIEWAVAELPLVRQGRVVAFSIVRNGEEQLVVIAEAPSSSAETLKKEIPIKVYESVGIQVSHVVIAGLGTLPQTSSGKLQRAKTKQLFENGEVFAKNQPTSN